MRFAVVCFGDRWSIFQDDKRAGSFGEQVDAIDVARRLAIAAQQAGATTELLVQDQCGEVRDVGAVVN